ncbi:flippase [Psychroserpens sp. MEBiC05023]
MINKIKKILKNLDVHTLEVLKKASTSIVVKTLGVFAKIVISVFLARALGADGLGQISIINQLIAVVMIFSMLGMDNVIIKQISIGYEKGNKKLIADSIYSSLIINGIIALFITLFGVLLSGFISKNVFEIPNLKEPLIIAFSVILFETFGRIFTSGINGYRKIWQSNLFREVLTVFCVLSGLVALYVLDIDLSIKHIILLYAIGKFITFIVSLVYWRKLFYIKTHTSKLIVKSMLKTALPLLFVTATSTLAASADVLMLGWLSNSSEVGLYTVASRLSLFIIFFLQVSNSAISPKLAALYADGRINEMNIMVKRVTLGLICIGFLFLALLIFGGDYILSIWGDNFKQAYLILVILGVGQLINISTGCSGLLLIMCGFEKTHSYISGFFVILNLILNYFLITNYGAIGAAIATSMTIIAENIFKVFFAKQKTGVLTIPFL